MSSAAINAAIMAIKNNVAPLEEVFDTILELDLPLAGLFQAFKDRSKLIVTKPHGPEEILRMKNFLYRYCFDLWRKNKGEVFTLKFLMNHGNAHKMLWNIVLETHADASRYMTGVAVLSQTNLPVDMRKVILDMAMAK